MADGPFQRIRRFLSDLKRRNVYRVAVTYAVVAFVVWQAASLLFPALGFPAWTVDFVIVFTLLGFPVALVLAWAFEMTPEGVRRTAEVELAAEETADAREGSRTGYKLLLGLGLLAAAVAGGWYITGGGGWRAGISDRSLAVLPFEAQGREDPGVLTEGMPDALVTRLSNVSELTVASSRAVKPYRNSELSTAEIARELGVEWVVDGQVQETEDRIHVNVQLVDPDTDTPRWAQSYTRDMTSEGLFAIQSDIVKEVTRSLEAELTPEERERVERQPTEDLDAYKLYVQGRSYLDSRTEADVRKAIEYFQRAIERDSSYALAWAGLTDAISVGRARRFLSTNDSLPEVVRTARRAVQLDPDLAEAHASMGIVHFAQGSVPAALREFKRAVALKPSYAQAHDWLGMTLLAIGRPKAAQKHSSLAVQLNPQHAAARARLVGGLIALDEISEARSHLHSGPLLPETQASLRGRILYHEGSWEELEDMAHGRLQQVGANSLWRFYLARIAVLRGDSVNAREQLAETRKEEALFEEGLVHAALGSRDSAFAAWRKMERWSVWDIQRLRYSYDDVLDPLRADPRFRELIGRINRQKGLNPDGSLPDSVDVSFGAESDE